MPPLAGLYLFLLGLASGFAVLAITSYRRVTPLWLRYLLMLSGAWLITRYMAMVLFAQPDAPQRFWALRHCWFASSVGLTLPSVFAIDQLIKHPAMSPRKLLAVYAPFLFVYAAVIAFGAYTPQPNPQGGWIPALTPGWQWTLSAVQAVFVTGFIGICLLLMRKLPSRRINTALLSLALAHGYLGLNGFLLAIGRSSFRPFLFSEMAALLALWHAYETAANQQTIG